MPGHASPLVLRAISYAARQHRHQVRKDGETPYVAHAMRVMLLVCREFGVTDEEVLAAAVLHDTIEDTHSDFDELEEAFGARVAGLVAVLTKDKRLPEEEREERFHAQVLAGPTEAHLIKLADALDNLIDSATATGGLLPKTLEKARRVAADLSARIPPRHQPALARLVAEISRKAGHHEPDEPHKPDA